MSSTQLFFLCVYAFLPLALLFNVLYFFVVLVRLGDKGKVGWDAIWNFRQGKYVELYLSTLPEEERRKWHNVFLKNSIYILGGLLAVGMLALAVSWLSS